MLGELYRYAMDHAVPYRLGFSMKSPRAYLWITRDGEFQDITLADKAAQAVPVPDVGSKKNGNICNPLIEKASIPLGIAVKEKKREFFLQCLKDGSRYEPLFGIAAQALESEAFLTAARRALDEKNIKPETLLGLCVDGQALEKSEKAAVWWEEYRKILLNNRGDREVCLITGRTAPAVSTVGMIRGLSGVGGQSSGSAFLSYDKDAFQSFGWEQGCNASVSEEAMAAVNAALERLIEEAPTLGGAKIVHWYSGEVPEEEDVLLSVFDGFKVAGAEKSGEEENAPSDASAEREKYKLEIDAGKKARALLEAVKNGKRPELGSARYYIMPLSGAGARVMVRGFEQGCFSELCRNLSLWFEDLRLAAPSGMGETRPPALSALMTRLLKPGFKADRKENESHRIDKELCGLSTSVLSAAVNGAPLPDEVAARALRFLRSAIVTSDGEAASGKAARKADRKEETLVYQWLKIWLRRRQRMKGAEPIMGERLNPDYPGAPYHCGRMMAVYAKIQEAALGKDIGAGVVERYYAAASRAPALVLGRLSQLGTYHLAKIAGSDDKKGLGVHYKKMLEEIADAIGETPVPRSLSIEQQTEFALGYYHQLSSIYHKEDLNNGNSIAL